MDSSLRCLSISTSRLSVGIADAFSSPISIESSSRALCSSAICGASASTVASSAMSDSRCSVRSLTLSIQEVISPGVPGNGVTDAHRANHSSRDCLSCEAVSVCCSLSLDRSLSLSERACCSVLNCATLSASRVATSARRSASLTRVSKRSTITGLDANAMGASLLRTNGRSCCQLSSRACGNRQFDPLMLRAHQKQGL